MARMPTKETPGEQTRHLNRHTLRAMREMAGVDVSTFAAEIGVSQPHLSNVEGGRRSASPALIEAAARRLGVSEMALTCEVDA